MENENSRRDFLKKSAALVVGTITASSILNQAFASGNFSENSFSSPDGGKYTLPALPYAYDALEPHIDKMTMQIHHDKHHAAYVTNVNKALESAANLANKPIEELL